MIVNFRVVSKSLLKMTNILKKQRLLDVYTMAELRFQIILGCRPLSVVIF